jgi:hypothetical protein
VLYVVLLRRQDGERDTGVRRQVAAGR